VQRFAIKGRVQTSAGLRFEAVDNSNWMTVRMMRLPDEGSPLQLHHKWFEKLQKVLPTLRHINICPIIELGKDDYGHYAAYFQMEGETLVDWLRFHGVMTQEDAVNVAEHTLAALGALAQVRLIHGDICPARLVVKRDTIMALNTTLIEPGLAMLLHPIVDETPGTPVTGHDVTTTAPEVLMRQAVDIRSDFYSLGVTLFYCLTGELPFPGATPQEVANSHLQHTPVSLDQYRADLPQSLCDWVMQLINRDPQARPASVAEAQQSLLVATGRALPKAIIAPVTKPVLQTVTASIPYVSTLPKAPVLLKSAAPKKSGALFGIIGATLAVITLVIILLNRDDDPKPAAPVAKSAADAIPVEATEIEKIKRYPVGRYVRIENTNRKCMNFAECQVFHGTTNIALKGIASSSSVYTVGLPAKGNDGKLGQSSAEGSVVHTKGNEALAWWEVDLLQEHVIENIIVWNRKEPHNHEANSRMDGFQVVILDALRKEIYRSTPTKAPESSVTFELRGMGKN
jgi:serine/threonine protein kinase